jgi:hypothetical protein
MQAGAKTGSKVPPSKQSKQKGSMLSRHRQQGAAALAADTSMSAKNLHVLDLHGLSVEAARIAIQNVSPAVCQLQCYLNVLSALSKVA